ncbi:hypothetical protein Glove_104g12 [Diversispora epigaea]|uniref:CCHC-type domain-containing protein n=1 Tax=Diversispora epigaea TaxID=1348612 RepID=A0A397J6T3_9GLOM|nr:hypothetical protein Glove_104g12 [Diversispora epigaea]
MAEGWGIAPNVDYENSWPIEETTLPPREQPLGEQPPWEQPPKKQPLEEQPPWEQPPKEQPLGEQPPWEQPPKKQPLGEQPPWEQPPKKQPLEQPPREQPPKKQPLEEQPPWEQPPKEQPLEEQPPWEQPLREQLPWKQPLREQLPRESPVRVLDDDESNVGLQEVIHNSFATRKIEKKLIEPPSKDSDLQWALKEDRLDDARFVLSSPEPTISSGPRKGTADKATQTDRNEINELNNVLTPLKPESFAVARKYLLAYGLILKDKNEQSVSKAQDLFGPEQWWDQKGAQREVSVDNNKKGDAFLRYSNSREVSTDNTRKQGIQPRKWNAPSSETDKNFLNQEPWQNQDIKSKPPSYNNQSRDTTPTFTKKPAVKSDSRDASAENPLISEPWWDRDQRNKESRDTNRTSSSDIKSDHVRQQERSSAKHSTSDRALSENSLNNEPWWDRKQNLNPSKNVEPPIATNKPVVNSNSRDSSALPQKTESWDSKSSAKYTAPNNKASENSLVEPWWAKRTKSQEPRGVPAIENSQNPLSSEIVESPLVTNKPDVNSDSWDSPVLPKKTEPWNSNPPKDSLARELSPEPWRNQQNSNAKSREPPGPKVTNSSKPPSNNVYNTESPIVTNKPIIKPDSRDSPVLPQKTVPRGSSPELWWNQPNSNAKSQEPRGAPTSKPPPLNNVEPPVFTNKPAVMSDSWNSPVLPQKTEPWDSNPPKDSLSRERSSEPWLNKQNPKSQEPTITKPPSSNEFLVVTNKPAVMSDSWDSPVIPQKMEWDSNPPKDLIARELSPEPWRNRPKSQEPPGTPTVTNSSKPPSNNVYNAESPIVTNKPIVKSDSWDSPVLPQKTEPWNSNLSKDSLVRERSSEPWLDQQNSNAKNAPTITNSPKPPSNNVESPIVANKPAINSDSWDSPVLPRKTEPWDTNPPKDSIARERSSEPRWNQQNPNAKSQEPLRANSSKPPSNNVYNVESPILTQTTVPRNSNPPKDSFARERSSESWLDQRNLKSQESPGAPTIANSLKPPSNKVESPIVTNKPAMNSDSWDSPVLPRKTEPWDTNPPKDLIARERSSEPRWNQQNPNAKSQEPLRANSSKPPSNNVYNVESPIVTNKLVVKPDSRESSSMLPPNFDSWRSNPPASAGTDGWLQKKELFEKELEREIPRNNISAPTNKEVVKSTTRRVFRNIEPQAAGEPEPWEKSEELEPWEMDNRNNRNNNTKTDYYENNKNKSDYNGNKNARSRSVSADELMRRGINCYKCQGYGHRASDCPGRNVQNVDNNYGEKRPGRGGTCYDCGSSEHMTSKCPSKSHPKPSPFADSKPSDLPPEEIWGKLMKADKENEPDDFRYWVEEFAKAMPSETFQTIERKLRKSRSAGRIMALKREEIPPYKCLMDLQGNTDKRYVAQIVLSNSSFRLPRTAGIKASSEEENYRWLADAGFMVDDPIPFCLNCKKKGHSSKDCAEPRNQGERTTPPPCQHCGSFDHKTRYCKNRSDSNNNIKRNDVRHSMDSSYNNRDDSLIDNNVMNDFEDRSSRNGYRGDKESYRDSNGYEQSRDTYNNNYSRKKDDGQNYNNYSRKNDESYNSYNNYTRKNDDGRGSYNNFDTNREREDYSRGEYQRNKEPYSSRNERNEREDYSRGEYQRNKEPYSSRNEREDYSRGEYQRNKEPYSSRNEKEKRYDTQDNNRRYNETGPHSNEDFAGNSGEESRGRSMQPKEVWSSREDLDNVKTWW